MTYRSLEVTPLQRAAWLGSSTAIRAIIAAGAEVDDQGTSGLTPLMFASKEAKVRAVHFLLVTGANVNSVVAGESPFAGMSPLHFAVGAVGVRPRAVEATARHLIRAGANVDHRGPDGFTPLMIAAARPRGRVVELLLESGANPNARSSAGSTPLMAVATYFYPVRSAKRLETAQLLLAAGAKSDVKDSFGNTVISCAQASGFKSLVRLLCGTL